AGIHAAQFNRGRKVDAEIQLDAVAAQDLLVTAQRLEIAVGNQPAGGVFDVDIVDDDAVDAHRSQHTGIVMQAVFLHQHLVVLEKERVAGVAAFNAAVHVVPMVQHAQYIGGGGSLVQLQFLPGAAGGLQGAQKGKHAVQHPDLAAAGNGA